MTMLVIVVVGAYAGYALWDNEQIYASADDVQKELLALKPKMEQIEGTNGNEDQKSSFASLHEINEDVTAWISLDNTMIDYPILYGSNNYIYLNRDVYGKFALAGSIFLDSRNEQYFHDRYNLIHGHHMANRKMFGDLDLYKDKTFFEENRTGILFLEDRSYLLTIFSALYAMSYDKIIFAPEKWVDNIEEPLRYAKDISVYKDDEMIERLLMENQYANQGVKEPQIIVMATCSPESDASRFILMAEMTPLEEVE